MKKNFNLKKIIVGIGFLLGMGTAEAQISAPSGSTHCTVYQDDCSLGSKVQVTFSINTGGISPIDPLDEYKVEVKLYRGIWTQAGWAFTVTDEVTTNTSISPVVSSPANFTDLSFFPTGKIYSVSRNGAYRARTTLMQNTVSNGWVVRYTTPLSPYYAVNDVTLEPIGDWAEVALIENLNVAPYFNYSINGKTSSSPVPTIITCPAVPLTIKNVTGGVDNPGTSTITVQKGTLTGSIFDPGSNPIQPVTFATTNADQNLYSLFSGLSTYAGALRVSYRIPDDVCGSTSTPVSKTMTISVTTAGFLNDYKDSAPSTTGSYVCSSTNTSKNTAALISEISPTMPSNTNVNIFKCELRTAKGWAGASSVGIKDVTFTGPFSVDVYEVDHLTGVRPLNAPSIYLNQGVILSGQQSFVDLLFNDPANGAEFDENAPYYVSTTVPADITGNSSGNGDFFRDYYLWAKANSALATMSDKVFCVEVNQYPAGGCVVSKKSFFKIANNGYGGTANGQNARMTTPDKETEDYTSLDIYPNPTKGELIIPVTEDDTNVSIRIMDNLGKEVYSTSDLKSGRINIEKLTAGIYFYTIQKNGEVYRGKVVKE